MSVEKLINWAEVSRAFGLDRNAIRPNRVSKKYRERIDKLLEVVEKWKGESCKK